MEPNALKHSTDLSLAHRAARGELDAWHEFVLSYSALIRAMVRRTHAGWSEDDQLNLYVKVLEYLYAQGLRRYDGRAALSTWVMTLTRSRCLDALRHERGRRRPPKWLQSRPELEQAIYRLHFLEFVPVQAIPDRLHRQGFPLGLAEVESTVEALELRMDRQSRKRLAYDREARSLGGLSGRVLETIDELRVELDDLAEACRPDNELFQARTRELLTEIDACVRQLGETERRVIELRFYDEMSAPGIARQLDLPGPRHVHTVIQQAIGLLRKMLDRRTPPPLPDAPFSDRHFSDRGGAPLEDSYRST